MTWFKVDYGFAPVEVLEVRRTPKQGQRHVRRVR